MLSAGVLLRIRTRSRLPGGQQHRTYTRFKTEHHANAYTSQANHLKRPHSHHQDNTASGTLPSSSPTAVLLGRNYPHPQSPLFSSIAHTAPSPRPPSLSSSSPFPHLRKETLHQLLPHPQILPERRRASCPPPAHATYSPQLRPNQHCTAASSAGPPTVISAQHLAPWTTEDEVRRDGRWGGLGRGFGGRA